MRTPICSTPVFSKFASGAVASPLVCGQLGGGGRESETEGADGRGEAVPDDDADRASEGRGSDGGEGREERYPDIAIREGGRLGALNGLAAASNRR